MDGGEEEENNPVVNNVLDVSRPTSRMVMVIVDHPTRIVEDMMADQEVDQEAENLPKKAEEEEEEVIVETVERRPI